MTDDHDAAVTALRALDAALGASIEDLTAARERITRLMAARSQGKTWHEVVTAEGHPLVVESLTSVLDRLSAVGSRFRRAQAQALHSEGLSMERVAMLFGVTRQRVSALLREREAAERAS